MGSSASPQSIAFASIDDDSGSIVQAIDDTIESGVINNNIYNYSFTLCLGGYEIF
jgi:hypothetical protein